MTPANGRVPVNALVAVQGNMALETATAAAYFRARAANPGLSIAPPLGADRDWAEQVALKANPRAYGSSIPSSRIAAPGHSTHGLGTCVDIAGGNAWFQANCGRFGFVRESPAGENNHYRFTAPTWAVANAPVVSPNNLTSDEVKRVAAYLNSRAASVGEPTTIANTNGIVGPRYWTLVQAVGKADGLYGTGFVVNGTPGNRTYWLEAHYRDITVPAPVVVAPPVVVTPPVITDPAQPVTIVVPPTPPTVTPVPDPKPTPPAYTAPVLTPVTEIDPTHMNVPLPIAKPTNWIVQLILALFGKH